MLCSNDFLIQMQVGLNLTADEILYKELMANERKDERPYKGDLPFNRPAPEIGGSALNRPGPSYTSQYHGAIWSGLVLE